jgi:Flp pilus assembly protein TadG
MRRHKTDRDDRGLVTIEFVLIAPFLFMLVFLLISLGMYFNAKMTASDQARTQARNAAIACTPTATPSTVSATVTASYNWFVPLLPYTPPPISETVTARCGG